MGSLQSSLDDADISKEIKKVTEIRFLIQEEEHVVNTENMDPNTSLNFYLRNVLHLTGTKGMCFEGGCGSCVVVLQRNDPITKKDVLVAVNSCLIPLLSCNGWKLFTIEGIGNPIDGYHPIQATLANFNGTQCGFCSPGMVMNMYALYESGKLTMEQVENSFSGNICRCTGYRPILSAFKSLCTDASVEVLGECPDMEDFVLCYNERRAKKCIKCPKLAKESFYLEVLDSKWIRVHALRDLLRILTLSMLSSCKLVAGNTAQGVYQSYKENVDIYIDISDVPELKVLKIEGNSCVVGASNTLADTIEFFTDTAKTYPQFAYLKQMATHISLIANVPVRNRATIAGNLMIKHDHNEFPSDMFVILESTGATLTVVDLTGKETALSPLEFINYDTKRTVLKTITLNSYSDTTKFVSYKIMPRAQNTHAHVNAGFLFKFNKNNLLENATIVYGNINPKFAHATRSEKLLQGKNPFDNSVLQQVYKTLTEELNPNLIPPDPSPALRKQLAVALFYKAVLSIAPPNKISPKNKSGGEILKRPVSKGTQDFETNKSVYPLTQAIPKLEAMAQTSGQAEYIVDKPDLPFQLFAVLVLAKAPPKSVIMNINATKALSYKDIVAFYTKKDIPGDNNFTPIIPLINAEEEIFCSGTVKYYEQPLGLLVGKNENSVNEAVNLVEVTYQYPNQEPATSVRQILKRGLTDKIKEYKVITAKNKGKNVKHVITGTFDLYQQYHFHMETHCCNVVPTENELTVYSSTQWIDFIQIGIAKMLKIPQNRVNVIVRRCGGAFGGKITRAGLPTCAAALASWLLKKPVKIWLPLTTNMAALGKRYPFSTDYEVGVDDKGVIQYLNSTHYNDVGYLLNEDISGFFESMLKDTYKSDTFTMHFNRAYTDTAVNTWARAPGSLEGSACIESIIEHISYVTNQDPVNVRLANFPDQSPLVKYVEDIKSWAEISKRKTDIASFNQQNRWKKRGLAVVPLNFGIMGISAHLVLVSICHDDGSVQICHGGIEVGQGINTKVAQVCAYKFHIPLEKIIVLPSNSMATTNSMVTGGSFTSENVSNAIIHACDELLSRMKPYQTENWEDTVKKCFKNNINLVAGGISSATSPDVHTYSVYGVCATEVLVDILTGQHIVTRVDLIEDAGTSMSPMIDVGQIEGAFIMGLGYQTMEKIVYNYEGKMLTTNTWTYLPPLATDIPVEFNVKIPKNNPNPLGILHSKATGEPAICVGISIPFAIRNALASARRDASTSNPKWYMIDGPTDVENVFLNSCNDYSQYVL